MVGTTIVRHVSSKKVRYFHHHVGASPKSDIPGFVVRDAILFPVDHHIFPACHRVLFWSRLIQWSKCGSWMIEDYRWILENSHLLHRKMTVHDAYFPQELWPWDSPNTRRSCTILGWFFHQDWGKPPKKNNQQLSRLHRGSFRVAIQDSVEGNLSTSCNSPRSFGGLQLPLKQKNDAVCRWSSLECLE